jgi:hypothetical protein
MNPELKAKWLEALRSGKYTQGRGRLKTNDNEYCCLGVLCDVSGKGFWDVFVERGQPGYTVQGQRLTMTASAVIDEGLPITQILKDGRTYPDSAETALVDMNDREGKSFEEIAKFVEEYL